MLLKTTFLGTEFKNPIVLASGTSGYAYELNDFFDVSKIGGVILKALTVNPRVGNKPNRVREVSCGMINAIGLANKGILDFENRIMPKIESINTNIIANVAGESIEEYVSVCKSLNKYKKIAMYEINVSCPNVHSGGRVFANDYVSLSTLIKECKAVSEKPIIVKLPPDIFNIEKIASICEEAGSDAISLINTVPAMDININTRHPYINNNFGGLSGECIKPIALRLVYLTSKAVNIPIIGGGGVISAECVLKFLMAGASLVSVGTLTLIDPLASYKLIDATKDIMERLGFSEIREIIGSIKLNNL